jgi:sugar phosphate permease
MASIPLEGKPLSREQQMWRWRILISTYLAYIAYYFTRKVFPLVKVSLINEFHWTKQEVANIWTAFLVAYMLGQFLNGFIGQRRGARFLLLGGLSASIAINIVFAANSSYWLFMAFMVCNGFVQATGWPGVVGGVAQWLRPFERGRYMGPWSTSYIVGNLAVKGFGGVLLGNQMTGFLAAMGVGSVIMLSEGWRRLYLACTAVAFVLWWVSYFWHRDTPQEVGLEPIVDPDAEDVRAIRQEGDGHVTLRDYFVLAANPVVLAMGVAYFCLKFLRYALDSWLPMFLSMEGLTSAQAAQYSMFFDIGGIIPCVLTGWALDKLFRGDWARLCFVCGIGLMGGYILVVLFEANPLLVALSYGVVGFMLYGPDTVLNGAAAVAVAGEKNAVALAALINGIGSVGPIVQEQLIPRLMAGKDDMASIHISNQLALGMSVFFAVMMLVVMRRVHLAHKGHREADAK